MKNKKISFKNRRGEKMIGHFYFPKGKAPFPTIIQCHGLSVGRKSRTIRYFAKLFPKLGFIHFDFDMTGHGESDGKLEDVTPSKAAEDVRSALQLVKKQSFVDKKELEYWVPATAVTRPLG